MIANAPIRLPRRALLRLAGLCAIILPGLVPRRTAAQGTSGTIVQPEPPAPRAFIDRAFALRRQAVESGDQPFGAVVVKDGRIVGQSQSRVVLDRDPTAHAEMEAIRDAARRTGSRDLGGCVLYSSSKPCPMCEAAAYWASVAHLYHGQEIADGGAPTLCS